MTNFKALVVLGMTVIAFSACTEKQDNGVSRKSDGTDSFSYKPSSAVTAASSPAAASTSSTAGASDAQKGGDGTESFHYKPSAAVKSAN